MKTEKIQRLLRNALCALTILKRKTSFVCKKVPSILSCNCTAGVIYHDLALPFLSPTINLYMDAGDFLYYALHLEEYKNATLTEKTDTDKPFPVGMLKADGLKDLVLFFMHYTSFEQAKEKWYNRYSRVDFDNIIVVLPLLAEGKQTQTLLDEFQNLPYKKVALVTEEYAGQPNTFVYTKEMFDPNGDKNLLSYRTNNRLLQWRYLDWFDYSIFLKSGKVKKRNI